MVLQPVDLDGFTPYALGASDVTTEVSDPALTPRAWYKANPDRTVAKGLEDALHMLRDVLSRDHYVGVFGFRYVEGESKRSYLDCVQWFSQGAAMAALLAALLEKPHTYPDFLVNGEPPHPPFQFCVSVSGFKVNDPLTNEIFGQSYATPTLHILGKTDVIVVEERSKVLLKVSANARVEEHEGGHFVPSKVNWRNFFRDYLRNPLGDVPSPSSGATSQSNSGIATPVTPSSNL
ncbi:serine hydrolase-domain-containing protein [Butyriboletus roseoflavus]|nr:serine hydrolase-domain-containing protein [Butyriboletus roseoflavus]